MFRSALALAALCFAVGCKSTGSSSWRWPWSKDSAKDAYSRNDADAIYGGRDPLLSSAPPPGRDRTGLDAPIRGSDAPAVPVAASSKKPFLVLGKPRLFRD